MIDDEKSARQTDPGTGLDGESRTVLLVAEDDVQLRAILARFLGSLGYDILQAEDGGQAVSLARKHKPAIILLDMLMPGMDGLDVLKTLAPEMPQTGFLMVTGNDDEDIARDCLQHGAFDYIAKPIRLEALERIVKMRLLLNSKR